MWNWLFSMAKSEILVDVTEAKKKLQEVTDMLEHIYKLIDKSWLLRLIFFGIKKAQ